MKCHIYFFNYFIGSHRDIGALQKAKGVDLVGEHEGTTLHLAPARKTSFSDFKDSAPESLKANQRTRESLVGVGVSQGNVNVALRSTGLSDVAMTLYDYSRNAHNAQ
jgi:hypothetical protein